MRTTLEAIKHLEAAVTGAGGIALRYGGFYGPGTGLAPGGEQWEMLKARKFPLVGDGGGVFSFAHIDDVASGTLAALEHGRPGAIYNICDDDPAPARVWMPEVAAAIGAPPPRHVPRWVGRLIGAHVVTMMCEIRGASNERAKRELGWEPAWPTWREGIPALDAPARGGCALGLGDAGAPQRLEALEPRGAPALRGGGLGLTSEAGGLGLGDAVAVQLVEDDQVDGRVHLAPLDGGFGEHRRCSRRGTGG